ncbi:hypothetical protein SR187_7210 [Streptococcus ruminantium]|uniref:Uncharacterized protein n=1 Tax=Streptococcus ruminantium TaxID=1917441 RepID=A0A2Z5TP82_9STRE|nr:hypothetical protein SR187_7210 [Streptococcus ruminantium]
MNCPLDREQFRKLGLSAFSFDKIRMKGGNKEFLLEKSFVLAFLIIS